LGTPISKVATPHHTAIVIKHATYRLLMSKTLIVSFVTSNPI
jgi:hypothetical protein